MDAHRRLRPRELGGEVLPAARPRRPQGRDEADVGGHGPAARPRAPGTSCSASPIPYFPDSQVPREVTRADMDRIDGRVRRGGGARRARRLRHDRAALRPRLPARELHLAAHQPAQRRIRRLAREPPALSARGVRARCARPGRRTSRCRCASRRPTGPRAASPATTRSRSREAFAEAGVDLVDVSTGQTVPRGAAGLRAHVPDAVLRPDPQRGAGRDDVRRQHHHRRPGQHHPRRRPRRPRGARPAAPRRPVLHHAGRGLVRRRRRSTARRNTSRAATRSSATASATAPISTICASAPSRRRAPSSRRSARRSGSSAAE